MDIFEATLKTKKFIYDNNPQLIKVDDDVEISGFSWLTFLNYLEIPISEYKNMVDKVKQYHLFDPEVYYTATFLKDSNLIYENYQKLTANSVNTKDYWNFIHENFPFCDVASYYKVTDLATYFVKEDIMI